MDAATGAVTQIQAGETGRALEYEVIAMEQAVRTGDASAMRLLDWDVMNIMTALRREKLWRIKWFVGFYDGRLPDCCDGSDPELSRLRYRLHWPVHDGS